jgi:hypothetical protein
VDCDNTALQSAPLTTTLDSDAQNADERRVDTSDCPET